MHNRADAGSNPAAVAKLPGENGETAYDLLKQDALSGHDGGLVPYTGSSISGRIWKDVNYNGLQEDGEAGISGLTVKPENHIIMTAQRGKMQIARSLRLPHKMTAAISSKIFLPM